MAHSELHNIIKEHLGKRLHNVELTNVVLTPLNK
jgi:hypothetical protein